MPKIQGSLNLHAATLDYPVETFAMFSSIYGLLGARDLAPYAAANAFQDGLAAARARQGLPALAVSWGTWADAGMAHRFGAGFEARVKSTGMRFVPLDAGLRVLAALAADPESWPNASVFPADWRAYAAHRRSLGAARAMRGLRADSSPN